MVSWLSGWWALRRKRRALRSYVQALAATLEQDYGREETYSVARITTALRKHEFSLEFATHAAAMFSSKSDFVTALEQSGKGPRHGSPSELYDELRDEAASLANGGSVRFMPKQWEEIGMHNGSDAEAAQRWGIGL